MVLDSWQVPKASPVYACLRLENKGNPDAQSPGSYQDVEGHAGGSLLSKLVANYYSPLFYSNVFKIGVVIIFAGLLGTMIYLGTKVEHGLKISEVTVKGSYQHDYAVVTENGFPVYDIWIVTKTPDYPNSQHQLLDIYETMQKLQPWAPAQPKKFLWGKQKGARGLPLVAWDIGTLPTTHGGLGITNIKARGLALVAKWMIHAIQADAPWKILVCHRILTATHQMGIKDPFQLCDVLGGAASFTSAGSHILK
eukprot:Gb_28349 [translate_table: standard]